LEDAEIAFDGVGVDTAAHVFASRMTDGPVRIEGLADCRVQAAFIGHEYAFDGDVFAHQRRHVLLGRAGDVEGTDVATTLDKAKHGALIGGAAAPLLDDLFAAGPSSALVGALPEIGFVGLNQFAIAAERAKVAVAHRLADAVSHEPRGFQGHAENAVKLVGRNALL